MKKLWKTTRLNVSKEKQKDRINTPLINALLEHCHEIISIKDLNYRYVDCNKSFLKHFGIKSRKNVVGKSIYEVIPENNLYFVKEQLDEVLKSKVPKRYSFKITTKSSLRIVQQTSTPIIKDGKVDFILSISEDITDEENLKNEILRKNNQLNTLLEHLPMLVYMKDKDLNYIIGSKNAKRFVNLGIDPYAKDVRIDMQKASANTQEEDCYVLDNKEILNKEKPALDYDGKLHWYNILKAPIIKKDNTVDGLVTIAQNIDMQKTLENQKDLFIATLVHDLKNPLLAQINFMNLFYKGSFGTLNDTQKEMLEITMESANYMKEMLYTLINTYKYDNGNVKLKKTKTNIEDLITTCIKENMALAENRKISLIQHSSLKQNEKIIKIDAIQLRRAISNLLNNGINYAFEGTDFIITLKTNNDNIVIEFKNTSLPIDEHTKNHIFEKYTSGAGVIPKGTIQFGLGMYLTKKIIDAHGGTISLETNDTSNQFTITLPRSTKSGKNKIIW